MEQQQQQQKTTSTRQQSEFSQWLRRRRREMNLSRREASRRCFVTPLTWHRWETDQFPPRPANLFFVVALMGAPPEKVQQQFRRLSQFDRVFEWFESQAS